MLGNNIVGLKIPIVMGTATKDDSQRGGKVRDPSARAYEHNRSVARESLISFDARSRRRANAQPTRSMDSKNNATAA
jgi:hypothetical protein